MTGELEGAIALPDGTAIRGRGRRDGMPSGPEPDFGLYLFRRPGTHRKLLRTTVAEWEPSWAADWVDWPDFRMPRDGRAAAASIAAAFGRARAGERVEVVCDGGTGRTGTVIACMAVLAGHPAAEALAWTRTHYRRRAVETPGQKRWIGWFAAHLRA
ncbi:protein-tyrosine phosphatase family protein [Pseudonocardia sp. GCM10023141]|uniref:protein-tyrosine phosphatase family protein n=1 Tax=Pseudonocardia sp. GCM10023141 TaxID=3252653 RepID=UPI0036136DA1